MAECTTPAEALKSLKRSGVDVILVDIGIAKDFIPWAQKMSVSWKIPGHRKASGCRRVSHRAEIWRLGHFSGVGFLQPADAGHTAGSERGGLGGSEGVATPGRAVPALSGTGLGQSHRKGTDGSARRGGRPFQQKNRQPAGRVRIHHQGGAATVVQEGWRPNEKSTRQNRPGGSARHQLTRRSPETYLSIRRALSSQKIPILFQRHTNQLRARTNVGLGK